MQGEDKMIIDSGEEKIDVCCYKMMQQLLYMGIHDEWLVCPFCGKSIEYSDGCTILETIGDIDELY